MKKEDLHLTKEIIEQIDEIYGELDLKEIERELNYDYDYYHDYEVFKPKEL